MKKALTCLLVMLLCAGIVIPAMAANVFLFTTKSVQLFEGQTYQTEVRREGNYDGDGEVVYAATKTNVATVSEDGIITAVGKGTTEVTASLMRNGKRVGQTKVTVQVLRAVQKVTLNTVKLSVYDPDHPSVASLLKAPTENQVLVIPAGTAVPLAATCTPEDASSKKITYTTSDAGVARISGTSLKAVQRGECDLTVQSAQNPEVTETFRVLVIQPVKKITIDAGDKKVAAGSRMELDAICAPDNASITEVTWSSKNPNIATVDESGMVTGVKKGTASIVATAADGSKVTGTVMITVTQPVTSINITQADIPVVVGRTAQAKIQVLPAEANDKTVTWSTSDTSIATVRNGQITGVKAGICTVTCTSNSNPEVSATATVTVSQLVTKIVNVNDPSELTLKTGESGQLKWSVQPDDATNKGLTFKSQAPKVATVDANGVVTAVGRGVATITATAQDASKRQGNIKVTVIQPVTGVSMQRDLYYVQRGGASNVRAVVQPKNANNQKVIWSSADDRIASVRSNGTITGLVSGITSGMTTVYAYTDDGGFTASTQIRVGDFNEAVMVESLEVNANNEIRIVLRNMSQELTLENVHYKIECFDYDGNPMICNQDGESTFFEGDYPFVLNPYERTTHGAFRFRNYVIDQSLGSVVLTILNWKDSDGYTWYIPEDDQIRTMWTRYNYNNNYNYNNAEQGVG
ncbi:Ig-like domain-containing protein [Aristaeella hokkaidonensis]|uniref:Ig-like domain-containing protein n=1 Tax=Aristaeella hokkaidonensis TaxID=3046382 RepID=A0AC61MWR9_9FIRM|nr:Ig-like domain-containing protein [Aristaeella hokkaidonensis]QUC67254.1 Ig-like domain-containing protein [Aristaeella hokkaidonensis]SNT93423.1 Ig-like domain (group 2) [Aristaeella hokkaidonensis]